jgi:hypothetical protein
MRVLPRASNAATTMSPGTRRPRTAAVPTDSRATGTRPQLSMRHRARRASCLSVRQGPGRGVVPKGLDADLPHLQLQLLRDRGVGPRRRRGQMRAAPVARKNRHCQTTAVTQRGLFSKSLPPSSLAVSSVRKPRRWPGRICTPLRHCFCRPQPPPLVPQTTAAARA